MTADRAVQIIDEYAAALHGDQREQLTDWTQWHKPAAELTRSLLETAPFKPMQDGWCFDVEGGGFAVDYRIGYWCLERLISGERPHEIVAAAHAEISDNTAQVYQLSPVFGCVTERTIKLAEGLELLPPSAIPTSIKEGKYLEPFLDDGFQRDDYSVLVQVITVSPAFVPRSVANEALSEIPPNTVSGLEAERNRELLRAAALIATNTAVDIPFTSTIGDRKKLLSPQTGKRGKLPRYYPFFRHTNLDEASLERNYRALVAFRQQDALLRAIDRLGRSRMNFDDADRALDLGVAAEIILTHGESEDNKEIGYKMRSRAAWLLGNDPVSRRKIYQSTRQLYSARSSAAHSGSLSNDSGSEFDKERCDDLVRSLIEKIMLQKKFPDWTDLVLGGDGFSTK